VNALDDAMFGALVATGENLKTHKGVRAVVLSGEGRAFHLQTSGDREGP
jgi:enoyl-CoA hydratase/carnithine racemase